jgi:hypothetical protein
MWVRFGTCRGGHEKIDVGSNGFTEVPINLQEFSETASTFGDSFGAARIMISKMKPILIMGRGSLEKVPSTIHNSHIPPMFYEHGSQMTPIPSCTHYVDSWCHFQVLSIP